MSEYAENRQAGRQADRQTDRQTDRDTEAEHFSRVREILSIDARDTKPPVAKFSA